MDSRVSLCVGSVVLTATLALTACRAGGSRLVLPVAFEEPAPAATMRYPDDFTSREAAVRGVGSILSRDLALPVPERVTVYIYSTRAVFEQGLMSDGRLPAGARARRAQIRVLTPAR